MYLGSIHSEFIGVASCNFFYDPSQSSVPHEPGSTFADQNNSSLPKSTESDVRTSTVKMNFLMKYLVTF